MDSRATLEAFDDFLTRRGLRFEGVAIGGAALNLMGVVSRATKDCDILDPEIPADISEAAREFAAEQRRAGDVLRGDWFNNGPRSLISDLPERWRERLQPLFEGRRLRLKTLGRVDLLRSKLFGLCDRELDLPDCIALAPTAEELRLIQPWLAERDLNPEWPAHVAATLAALAQRLGYGL